MADEREERMLKEAGGDTDSHLPPELFLPLLHPWPPLVPQPTHLIRIYHHEAFQDRQCYFFHSLVHNRLLQVKYLFTRLFFLILLMLLKQKVSLEELKASSSQCAVVERVMVFELEIGAKV